MREAGRVVAQTHELVREHLRPGVTTKELDRIIDEFDPQAWGDPQL